MNTSKRLLHSYTGYIKTPWRPDVAAPQRVIFCIYPETEELRLRAHLGEFELATRNAAHDWSAFDITDAFPTWMAAQEPAVSGAHLRGGVLAGALLRLHRPRRN